ncbi:g8068 [Coccomyxa viridis]|uniref:G8068 protein n=1 Tax=Coccomyxa viridis TaxID=1274662 RepID=A0ABP1FZK2_9CHLO
MKRRFELRAVKEAPQERDLAFATVDDGVWETKYEDLYGTLDFGASSAQGPRESMEDCAYVIPRARCGFLFAAVFDGHSGFAAAQYLSEHLYDCFSDAIDEGAYGPECSIDERETGGICCPVELSSLLADSFRETDQKLLSWLQSSAPDDEKNAGATATIALVRRDKLVIANVGDSRAVLSRKGQAVDLTTEHRVTGSGPTVEAEVHRVEDVGGWIEDGRVCDVIAVSRAFGDREFKGDGAKSMLQRGVSEEWWDQEFADSKDITGNLLEATPDVVEAPVREDDEFLILATDGLWDVVTSHEAVTMARSDFKKRKSAEYIADRLTKVALQRRTEDNVSVVVVDLTGKDGWTKPKQKNSERWKGVFGMGN